MSLDLPSYATLFSRGILQRYSIAERAIVYEVKGCLLLPTATNVLEL